ncbi:HAD-IIIA family hydrolase [Georgenia deserti]|uniref:D,D-heptose 1,7-bisphosphate phosphatase n=1 Tax=Georgenia deserti TaxID=2093781 RepID=A0ABW4L6M3_9MICO
MTPEYAVVVPSVGRPSLETLLRGLSEQELPPVEVVVADDRPLRQTTPLAATAGSVPVRVVRSGGRGPAAARNAGWRSTTTPWIAFLDDDIEVPRDWSAALAQDLDQVADDVAGVQGRITVPLPASRRPTDWERNTAGLEGAVWATADMVYRRRALEEVAGFDERFPRAYREDADLALRIRDAGWRLVRGGRHIVHPVRPADWRVSLRVQAGAADDALMRSLHGPAWRERAETGQGRFRWHAATVAAACGAALAGLTGHRRTATALAACWAGLTADFTIRRVRPGPRPGEDGWTAEGVRMAVTSAAIPFAAVVHRARGLVRNRDVPTWPPPLRAVLFDRDGTLVHDEPYNGDPALVRPVDGAAAAVGRLREAGIAVGVVTNQSGIGRGLLTADQAGAVNARIEEVIGPVEIWQICPHRPDAGCTCRKPAPGMILGAAAALGISPAQCAVIGDIGADVAAAHAAGARAVLVPTPQTRPEEVDDAATTAAVAADVEAAVELLLRGDRRTETATGRPAPAPEVVVPS